jgi:O-antigen/teichoic acid export membrane protein
MFRDIIKGLAKNTTIMMVQQVFTWGSTFLLMLYLPRIVGPVAYGRLFVATSVTEIFRVLITFGGPSLVAKTVSRSPGNTPQILVDAMGFRFLLTIISLLAVNVFAYLAGYPDETRMLIAICGLTLLWQPPITALFGCYQGHELIKYISYASVAERVFTAIVGVSALLMGANVVIIAVVMLAASLLNFSILVTFGRRVASFIPRINWKGSFEQMRVGTPYFLFSALSIIYYRIDSVMLSKMTPDSVVGWYGGAYRLFDTMAFVPTIFSFVVFPVLARLWEKEGDAHKRTTHKSLEYVIIAGIPIGIGVIILAKEFVSLFYGLTGYGPSVQLLQILTMSLIFLYVDIILGTTLLASDKQRQLSIVSLCAIPVNVGLNLIFIPHFQTRMGNGAIGAAVATGITEFCVMCAYLGLMPKGILTGFRYQVLAKTLASGLVMGGGIWLVGIVGIPSYITILIAPMIYAVPLFLLRTFEKAETDFLLGFLRTKSLRRLFKRWE